LRKQLALHQERRVKRRWPDLATRVVLVLLSRLDWRALLTVVQPDTLIRWHRQGWRSGAPRHRFWEGCTMNIAWRGTRRDRPQVLSCMNLRVTGPIHAMRVPQQHAAVDPTRCSILGHARIPDTHARLAQEPRPRSSTRAGHARPLGRWLAHSARPVAAGAVTRDPVPRLGLRRAA
jgi:hypothetical protein